MPDKLLSTVAGSGTLVRLAPDLSYPSVKGGGTLAVVVSQIDCTAGLTSVLSLSGKFAISHVFLDAMTNESVQIKLTIDGVVIHNSTFILGSTNYSVVGDASSFDDLSIQCNTSFLLEVATTTDASIDLRYVAKPIL